jgi:hypothetical protein
VPRAYEETQGTKNKNKEIKNWNIRYKTKYKTSFKKKRIPL